MAYTHRCTLCLQSGFVDNFRSDANMSAHLGAPNTHNMGPFECQIPGCGRRSQRQDRNNNHGNHQAVWARPQALVRALDREIQACQQAWINNAAAAVPPVATATNAAPPVVAPPQAVPTGTPIAAAQGLNAVQGPPASVHAAQVPPAAVPVVAVPPVVAPPVAAPRYTKGPDGTPGWIAPSAADPNWTPPDETAGHYLDAEAVTTRRHNQGKQSDSSEEE